MISRARKVTFGQSNYGLQCDICGGTDYKTPGTVEHGINCKADEAIVALFAAINRTESRLSDAVNGHQVIDMTETREQIRKAVRAGADARLAIFKEAMRDAE